MAALLKSPISEESPGKRYARIVTDFAAILTFADYRRDLCATSFNPVYKIIRQSGTVPRFSKSRKTVFQFIREQSSRGLSDIRDLFKRSCETSFSFESSLCLGDKSVSGPAVVVENCFSMGYDVSIKINMDANVRRQYEDVLVAGLHSLVLEKNLNLLADIVLLFWLMHPLSYYSEELGHAVWNGVLLGLFGVEMKERIPPEVFIEQLVKPSVEDLRGLLGETKDVSISASSVEFWTKMPSMSMIFHMFRKCFVK
jgi:hypothetical protein